MQVVCITKYCIANTESSNISQNTVSLICSSSLAFIIFLASCHLLGNVFDRIADGLYKKPLQKDKKADGPNQSILSDRTLLGGVKFILEKVMSENMVLNSISYSYSCD